MGMKLRQHEVSGTLATTIARYSRYVYDVYREDGTKVCQCGSKTDAQLMVELHPEQNRFIVSVPLPAPPKVVNVSYTEGETEKQLESQNILPETQQQPFTT